jgi:hypothetical protein
LVLTERDKKIFADLKNYSVMTTTQIARRHFPDRATTTVLRRLRSLDANCYIRKLKGLETTERCWLLARKAALLYSEKIPRTSCNRLTLHHDVTLVDLRLLLEGHWIARGWTPEHELRAKVARDFGHHESTRRPVCDGVMAVLNDGKVQSICVELELHYKNRKRYRDLLNWYIGREEIWGLWYVVHSKSLGKHLADLWKKDVRGWGPYFLWSELSDVMKNGEQAIVHCGDQSYKMSDLWFTEEIVENAHRAAQQVSSPSQEDEENQNALSSEKDKETLAQTG